MKTSAFRPLMIPLLLIVVLALPTPEVRAQGGYGPRDIATPPPSINTNTASKVKFEQKLGAQIPLDLVFRDEEGREAPLASHLGRRPAILAMVFHSCPLLCSQIMGGLTRSLKPIPLQPGVDFDVLAVSFDPADTPSAAKEKKAVYLDRYDRPGSEDGWKFLTGNKEEIDALCEAIGFEYVYTPETKQFAHAAGIVVLTPGGQAAQYFFGIDYPAKELEAVVKRAGEGRLGSKIHALLLLCYDYD
ncbi:MAG: SCO family protein, partial [Actinomycetota bacterium]|nr:SCO family protein [Actinomycetota bacterium]